MTVRFSKQSLLSRGIFLAAIVLNGCAGAIEATDDDREAAGGAGSGESATGPGKAPPAGSPGPAGPATTLPQASAMPPVAPAPGTIAPNTFKPSELRWQRLTSDQLHNTLIDLFGAGIATSEIEPDVFDEGFANLAAVRITTSTQGVERLGELAFKVAAQVMMDPARRARWVRCVPAATNLRACAEETFKRLGRAVFRSPVDAETMKALVALAEKAATELGDPARALEFGLAAMMQSPRFLYLLELPEGDLLPGSVGKVSAFTLASRLSYFLWNSTPDELLLDAAAAGELASPDGIKRQAERMLAAPRARTSLRRFFSSLWDLEQIRTRSFDKAVFPKAPATLGESAFEETMRFLEHHLMTNGSDLIETLASPVTFVNRDLALMYKLPAPTQDGFVQVTMPPAAQRFGLLTQVSMLATSSSSTETSPMLRGKAIREDFLCQEVPEPPPGLMAVLPDPVRGKAMTKRQRLGVHRTDAACAACHRLIDPIGLALETYDATGAHRTTENGLAIDSSGDLDGTSFIDVPSFIAAVRGHRDLAPCMARKLFRYATAHVETEGERPLVNALAKVFDESGRSWPALLLAIASSDGLLRMTMPKR